MSRSVPLTVLCAIVLLTAPALADDMFPPAWRGQPRTVAAGWDYFGLEGLGPRHLVQTEAQLIQANPGGFSTPWPAQAGFNSGVYCHNLLWGRQSVLEILDPTATLGFTLANYEGGPLKEMLIQITFRPGFGTILGFSSLGFADDPGQPPWPFPDIYEPAIVIDSFFHTDGWQTNSYMLIFEPNPSYEGFGIHFGIHDFDYPVFIDQVVIDTWCIPEPASGLLLALLGLALRRR
jgi:hypothetical protein